MEGSKLRASPGNPGAGLPPNRAAVIHSEQGKMEKRRERRFKQWNKTSIKSASGPREFPDPAGINAYTYDISLGGAKVYSDVDFPVGTAIRIQIDLVRSKQSVSIDGVVRWAKRKEDYKVFELGVEFFHVIPKTVFTLMQNLYDQSTGIPTKISERQDPAGRRRS
jgi:c-di-GMP-binding flagellar brake protein YcgR